VGVGGMEQEGVDRHLAILVVCGELEALREKRSQHQLPAARLALTLGAKWIAETVAALRLRDDVEVIVGLPAGTADDLKVLQLIRVANQLPQRHVRRAEAPARLDL